MPITHCIILISKFYVMPYFIYLLYVALNQTILKLTNFTYNYFIISRGFMRNWLDDFSAL